MNEEKIIGFDDEVEVKDFVALDEGVYKFTYCGYTKGNTNPRDGGISYPTGIAKLKLENVMTGEVLESDETFIMTQKWMWKLTQFWKSLGAKERQTPDGKKTVQQGWNSMVGQRGYLEVTKTPAKDGRKKEDGTPVVYTNKNFIEPEKVNEVMEKYKAKEQPKEKAQSWGW